MNFLNVVTESCPISDQVYSCDIIVRDSSSNTSILTAKLFCFEIGENYPTEHLSKANADIWLIQEEFDSHLEKNFYPGQWVGWVDHLEKDLIRHKQVNAAAIFGRVLTDKLTKPLVLKDVNVSEVFLHPYPLGAGDEQEARDIQKKLITKYQADMFAEIVDKNLLKIVLE